MKAVLHLTVNFFLLMLVVFFLYNVNEGYSKNTIEMQKEISDLSIKVKSGDEVLSPLQYSEILDVVNDRGIYYFYLNISGVISLVFYVLSICMFYMGISVGKKSIQVKK
ncbi:hypothetical protein A9R00_08235 [Oleispira antarctica]|uniref:Uncharacterized protein n=1 Tax=Oleispira antarctica TaxID=188908 RepID=A0A1Y5HRP9_OLEAN|nr:hypothetical protein A9R00_08235 [Oleispira antarctica]